MVQPSDHDEYSNQGAAAALAVARMTQTFDRTFNATKDHTAAAAAVSARTDIPHLSHYNFITVDATTAIVAYDPLQHRAVVSFDPTHSLGDKWDAFQRDPEDHPLGGHVHGGVYEDMISEQDHADFPGDNMREVIEGILHDNASHDETRPLTVDFAGFSMGGAKSAIMAGELIAHGIFDHGNMQMGNIHTFGPPSYADTEFTNALEQRVRDLGGTIWMVQLHGDTMPDTLSPKGRGFAKYTYDQAGAHVYIVPAHNGADAQILISPTDEELNALAPADADIDAHSSDLYQSTLDQLAAGENADGHAPAPAGLPAPDIRFKP